LLQSVHAQSAHVIQQSVVVCIMWKFSISMSNV